MKVKTKQSLNCKRFASVCIAGMCVLWMTGTVWANTVSTASSPGELLKTPNETIQTETDTKANETKETVEVKKTGWLQEMDGWRYYLEDGTMLSFSKTPDGYYMDGNGLWREKTFKILGLEVQAEPKFRLPSSQTSWQDVIEELDEIKDRIQDAVGEIRTFHVYEDSIVYCQVEENEERVLLELSKNPANESYQFTISCDLGKQDGDLSKISGYDYSVFFYLCCQISNYPQEIADAIYGNWQGNNSWGLTLHTSTSVMETIILCDAKTGAGVYTITGLQ